MNTYRRFRRWLCGQFLLSNQYIDTCPRCRGARRTHNRRHSPGRDNPVVDCWVCDARGWLVRSRGQWP